MLDKLRAQAARHPHLTLALITIAALLPFLAKPFNIDDPLFVWAAKQIHAHPADPYGFNVNWNGREFPMSQVTENPPLACYYLALAAGVFGWNEIGLHLAFLLPAIAAIVGTYQVAKRFCKSPEWAALLTLFTPVFLVSASTVMCDVLMLAFWVWAIAFWLDGIERKSFRPLAIAGVLVSLAVVTKYFGVCLIPLLAAHGLAHQRRLGRWALALLIPVATICIYQFATSSLYGVGLLSAAGRYASFATQFYEVSKLNSSAVALAFTGGCAATAVFFAPLLWRWTPKLIGIAAFATLVLILIVGGVFTHYADIESPVGAKVQFVFWALGGLSILALATAELWRRRDAGSWLLALWAWGTFVFTALINWTVNGRSVLPLVPAIAILIARRLEQFPIRIQSKAIALAAGAALSLIVVGGDVNFAHAVRELATKVASTYQPPSKTLWFQGHWGFQYYMQEHGGSPVDFKSPDLKPGDIIAVPSDNTNLRPLNPETVDLLGTVTVDRSGALDTMDSLTGAGFYSSLWGPLPFAFGHVAPEYASVYQLKQPTVATPANPQ
jgi:4-amino-4-deoxy-L-arabinose transferase-like glycosyltransferase